MESSFLAVAIALLIPVLPILKSVESIRYDIPVLNLTRKRAMHVLMLLFFVCLMDLTCEIRSSKFSFVMPVRFRKSESLSVFLLSKSILKFSFFKAIDRISVNKASSSVLLKNVVDDDDKLLKCRMACSLRLPSESMCVGQQRAPDNSKWPVDKNALCLFSVDKV